MSKISENWYFNWNRHSQRTAMGFLVLEANLVFTMLAFRARSSYKLTKLVKQHNKILYADLFELLVLICKNT